MTAKTSPGAAAVATIAAAVRDDIQKHGAETFPHECCGALISVDGVIVEAYRLPNTTAEGAARRFRVGPADYRAAEARATERKGALAGFYHSHPNEPARPSQYDLDHAWPNLIYVIISVNAGIPGDITAWHLRDDRAVFDQGDLRWHTGS